MPAAFDFTPPVSEKAAKFLAVRAEHLRKLTPAEQVIFLKSAIALARQLPLSVEENVFTLSNVLLTLQRWLDEVEAVAA